MDGGNLGLRRIDTRQKYRMDGETDHRGTFGLEVTLSVVGWFRRKRPPRRGELACMKGLGMLAGFVGMRIMRCEGQERPRGEVCSAGGRIAI